MRRYGISTVPRETELQLAQWAKTGYEHPRTEQYKHGESLNPLSGGRYSANIIGFVLMGKFGDPRTAYQQLQQVEGRYWELLGLTQEQAEPLDYFGACQDCDDVGTETIICDLFNVQHLQVHVCGENEWGFGGDFLNPGAVVMLPVSDQAKEWLALAADSQNRKLRNVRINDLETGCDDCKEMRLCTNGNGQPAIFVHYRAVEQKALDLRLWWLTRMLNLFMPDRIAEINRRMAA